MGGSIAGVTSPTAAVAQTGRPATLSANERKRLMEACEEFESLFTHMLLRSMRRSVPKTGLTDGGAGEEIFQDMLDEKISVTSAKTGQLGLARVLFEQLTRSRIG
ncbi:MAG: flagellar biosynthesis protein FlgJ [Firmicutes bacterium]|jgi:flagellar protein FlgJ|nr:flagellar biosynthesis protein FlgJ [Bacillota bacterium]